MGAHTPAAATAPPGGAYCPPSGCGTMPRPYSSLIPLCTASNLLMRVMSMPWDVSLPPLSQPPGPAPDVTRAPERPASASAHGPREPVESSASKTPSIWSPLPSIPGSAPRPGCRTARRSIGFTCRGVSPHRRSRADAQPLRAGATLGRPCHARRWRASSSAKPEGGRPSVVPSRRGGIVETRPRPSLERVTGPRSQ